MRPVPIAAVPEAKRAKRADEQSASASTIKMTQDQQTVQMLAQIAIVRDIASHVTKKNEVLADMQKNMKTMMGEVFDDKVKPLESRMNMLEQKMHSVRQLAAVWVVVREVQVVSNICEFQLQRSLIAVAWILHQDGL